MIVDPSFERECVCFFCECVPFQTKAERQRERQPNHPQTSESSRTAVSSKEHMSGGGLLAEAPVDPGSRYVVSEESSDHSTVPELEDAEQDSEDEKGKSTESNPSASVKGCSSSDGIEASSHTSSLMITEGEPSSSQLTVTPQDQAAAPDDASDMDEHGSQHSMVGVGVDSVTPTGSDMSRDVTLVHDISDALRNEGCAANTTSVRQSDDDEHGEMATEPSADEKTGLLRRSSESRMDTNQSSGDDLTKLADCSLLAGPSNPRTQRRMRLAQQNEPLTVTFDEKVIVRKIKAWDPCGPTFYSSEYGGRPSDSQSTAVAAPSGSCCLVQ